MDGDRTALDRFSDRAMPNGTPRRTLSASADTPAKREPPACGMLTYVAAEVPRYETAMRGPADNIELELSLGVARDRHFHPGVRHPDFMAIKKACEAAALPGGVSTENSVDYWYTDYGALFRQYGLELSMPWWGPGALSMTTTAPRLRVSTRDGRVVACQLKMPCQVHTATAKEDNTLGYDVRVHVNYEQTLDLLVAYLSTTTTTGEETPPPPGWTCVRTKARTIVRLARAPDWVAHLTIVLHGAEEDVMYEVEFEYSPQQQSAGTALQQREVIVESTRNVYRNVVSELNVVRGKARSLGPSVLPDFVCELPPASSAAQHRVLHACASGVGSHGVARRPFVGAMPRNLTRVTLAQLSANRDSVWIAEKTDGVRVMMAITTEGDVFFVDRNDTTTALAPAWPELCRVLRDKPGVCDRGPTVLDGELVHRHGCSHGDYTFIVFDMLMRNGSPQNAAPFDQLVTSMYEFVTDVIRPAVDALNERARPFDVRCKRFLPFRECREVFYRTRPLEADEHGNRERVFTYDESHAFLVDGLIFVRVIDRRREHYKWKPAWKCTVDFRLVQLMANHRMQLAVAGDTSAPITMAEVTLNERQRWLLTRVLLDAELSTRSLPRSARTADLPIVECRYNPDTAQWDILSFRTDKRKPNHVSVAMATVCETVRPITIAEILGAGAPRLAQQHPV